MEFERPSNVRPRLDGHEMLKRDAKIAGLPKQDVSFREIARRLQCSLGSVQKSVERTRRRAQAAQDLVDDDDDAFELPLDDIEPVGSVRFVGVEERIEWLVDERSRRFNLLDLYRYTRVDGGWCSGTPYRS